MAALSTQVSAVGLCDGRADLVQSQFSLEAQAQMV